MTPDDLIAAFPDARVIEARALEARDLLRSIRLAEGEDVLRQRLTGEGVWLIDNLNLPEADLDPVIAVLHDVAATVGATFVTPAVVMARVAPTPIVTPQIQEAKDVGEFLSPDHQRIQTLRRKVDAMVPEDLDRLSTLTSASKAAGTSLNILNGGNELTVKLAEVAVALAEYPSDVQAAVLSRTLYDDIESSNVAHALARLNRHQACRAKRVLFALHEGRLRLTFDCDGAVNLTASTSNNNSKETNS